MLSNVEKLVHHLRKISASPESLTRECAIHSFMTKMTSIYAINRQSAVVQEFLISKYQKILKENARYNIMLRSKARILIIDQLVQIVRTVGS